MWQGLVRQTSLRACWSSEGKIFLKRVSVRARVWHAQDSAKDRLSKAWGQLGARKYDMRQEGRPG